MNALINFIHRRGMYGNYKLCSHLRLRVRSIKIQSGNGRNIDSFLPSFIGLIASLNLFKAGLSGVLGSPISFFDTTPMGTKILLLFQ